MGKAQYLPARKVADIWHLHGGFTKNGPTYGKLPELESLFDGTTNLFTEVYKVLG